MKKTAQILKRIILISYFVVIHMFAALFVYHEFVSSYFTYHQVRVEIPDDPNIKKTDFPPLQPKPSLDDVDTPSDFNASQNEPSIAVSNTTLMIPVAGVKREDLQDTYTDSRSEGRVHNAIDIAAALGTPVVAVSDGEIVKFFDSERGGITIYQFSPDKNFIYYYAHLQKRAENLREHDFVKQGTIIGYVGDSGNAGAGNYHLHFEIMISEDPNNFSKGTDINPFPLLKNAIESN